MKPYIHFALLALLVLTAAACSDSFVVEPPDVTFPASNVSFNGHIMPLFDESCATSGCHDEFSWPQSGHLQLTSYNTLMNEPGMVVPGDSTGSRLTQTLSGRGKSHPRSTTYDAVTFNQKHGIAVWVQEGALNN
jgi:hypothetical protein